MRTKVLSSTSSPTPAAVAHGGHTHFTQHSKTTRVYSWVALLLCSLPRTQKEPPSSWRTAALQNLDQQKKSVHSNEEKKTQERKESTTIHRHAAPDRADSPWCRACVSRDDSRWWGVAERAPGEAPKTKIQTGYGVCLSPIDARTPWSRHLGYSRLPQAIRRQQAS